MKGFSLKTIAWGVLENSHPLGEAHQDTAFTPLEVSTRSGKPQVSEEKRKKRLYYWAYPVDVEKPLEGQQPKGGGILFSLREGNQPSAMKRTKTATRTETIVKIFFGDDEDSSSTMDLDAARKRLKNTFVVAKNVGIARTIGVVGDGGHNEIQSPNQRWMALKAFDSGKLAGATRGDCVDRFERALKAAATEGGLDPGLVEEMWAEQQVASPAAPVIGLSVEEFWSSPMQQTDWSGSVSVFKDKNPSVQVPDGPKDVFAFLVDVLNQHHPEVQGILLDVVRPRVEQWTKENTSFIVEGKCSFEQWTGALPSTSGFAGLLFAAAQEFGCRFILHRSDLQYVGVCGSRAWPSRCDIHVLVGPGGCSAVAGLPTSRLC